jgi:cobalt-zinc-cadmium efflux system protein
MPHHGHRHGHAHGSNARGEHPHVHGSASSTERRILWVAVLTGTFMMVEALGGLLSGSLALLADAGHMLGDVGSLVLAYAGIRLGRRPGDPRRTYGYERLEVLAAFVNGLTLIVISIWIVVEAAGRFLVPGPVLSGPMLAVAVVGLAVNVGGILLLHGHEGNLNVRGALAHIVGDLFGSIAAIVAALVIRYTGFTPIDPILAALVALLILRSGWDVVRRSGHILLEGAPEDIDREEIAQALAAVPEIERVHHIHVWSLTSGSVLATLHLRPLPGADPRIAVLAAKAQLQTRFGIAHSTIELDLEPAAAPARRE